VRTCLQCELDAAEQMLKAAQAALHSEVPFFLPQTEEARRRWRERTAREFIRWERRVRALRDMKGGEMHG
jgi:hypothetical protein